MGWLQLISVLASLGVWTHFMHPDQILDMEAVPGADYLPQNPKRKGWRKSPNGSMLNDFASVLSGVRRHYPWLRYMTASPAADVIRAHFDNTVSVYRTPKKLIIKVDVPCDIQVRIVRGKQVKPISRIQGELLHRYEGDGYSLLTLRMNSERLDLFLEERC